MRRFVWTWTFVALLAGSGLAQRGDVDVARYRSWDEAPAELRTRRRSPPAALAPYEVARTLASTSARPAIMLTGYWPPTNEMLRRFSDDAALNPDGWIGADWEGRGYDVYAYFPEFDPPDCINCGKGVGDLEVDYQDTSADFWPLADGVQPVAVVTFSRGNDDTSWEVEMNQYNRLSWINDFVAPLQPTPTPPDASVPAGFLRPSLLPAQAIVDAVDALGFNIEPFICFTEDGGGFLSEFVAYHGVWYQALHADPADPAWCVTAGHVHVGGQIPVGRARLAAEATLRTVIDLLDGAIPPACQLDLGFGGPGGVDLSLCGDVLRTGGVAELRLSGAPATAPAAMLVGVTFGATSFKGGTLVPIPALLSIPFVTDGDGEVVVPVAGGGGDATAYLQAVVVDASEPLGFAISNAVEVVLLP